MFLTAIYTVRSMEAIQTNRHKGENYILKGNLWKFFKALRAQANPIYCLLVASPIHYAWITILDKSDSASQKRISIAQFVNALKKMPSTGKYYQLSLNLWSSSKDKYTHNMVYQSDLSIEMATTIFPDIVAYYCVEEIRQGACFELTPQTIQRYKFKARYHDELKTIIKQCNDSIYNLS